MALSRGDLSPGDAVVLLLADSGVHMLPLGVQLMPSVFGGWE